MAKFSSKGLDAEDISDMRKGTFSPKEERRELATSRGKGHSNPRPTGNTNNKSFNNTTGPQSTSGHTPPKGGSAGKQHSIINTLAARQFNGIARMRGGGAKQ